MATRGRKPTPTAIKELEGNPGKRPMNSAEPKPEKKAPPCPKWLEPEAKKEWRRLSKQLEQIGVLTEVDQAAFASYCQAYARWKEAEEFITQHGTIVKTPSGYWQQVPQVSIAQTYLKIMNRPPDPASLPVPVKAVCPVTIWKICWEGTDGGEKEQASGLPRSEEL